MKEIKFRMWHRDFKKMYYDIFLREGQVKDKDGTALWGGYEYVMQFTEWKDKNKKEIYEGDILKSKEHSIIFDIIFDNGSFKPNPESGYMPKQFYPDIHEVIGNIYKNPKLIK